MSATVWDVVKLQKLRDAITSGVLTVEYQDHRVTYQNVTEMMRVLATAEASLNAATRPGFRLAATSKGV